MDVEKKGSSTAVAAPSSSTDEGGRGGAGTEDDSKAKAVPPTVITVDTSSSTTAVAALKTETGTSGNEALKEGDSIPSKGTGDAAAAAAAASQARTPKHANKNSDDHSSNNNNNTSGNNTSGNNNKNHGPSGPSFASSAPTAGVATAAAAAAQPPRPFTGGSGAFQPHYQQQQNRLPPMQVSPGSGRYYPSFNGPNPTRFGPPPYTHEQPYNPQASAGFQRPYGAVYHYENSHGGWGPPPSFPHGRPPAYPMQPQTQQQDYNHQPPLHQRQQQPPQGPPPPPPQQQQHHQPQVNCNRETSNASDSNTFSRAVSSSFDRSIKSNRDDNKKMDLDDKDNHSVSGDASWGQLNQVASVDEEEMRKRLAKRDHTETPEVNNKELKVAASNSSSLTNSPTEGVDGKKQQSKAHSSLDSLSSVASAQVPMKSNTLNESGSHASLDLMKCPSGSSALLLPTHQRHDSQFSFGNDAITASKRGHDEERGDLDTNHNDVAEEIRKAPSAEEGARPSKKKRTEKDPKKSSPLSIECSPPTTPSAEKGKGDPKIKHPQPLYGHEPTSASECNSFYDKPPSYTYSIDSAPPMPRDPHVHPPQPAPRPGSSNSTITPMHIEGNAAPAREEHRHQPGVGPIPSWDIQPQDSFGAGSAHASGGPLISSFSFTQDYPMLGASASADQGHGGGGGGPHHGQHPLESRNQSFDGQQYHRSDSMMSYEGTGSTAGMAPYDSRNGGSGGGGGGGGYHGPFPPQAPSWGSASSFHQTHGYGQYQNYPPPMMRNFSEDSGARTSPPPGHGGMRVMQRGGFQQPPPEFRAPPSMVAKGGSQPQHIISSPYGGGKGGSYGWSKGEDMRLTEIMKKYKNPRDWEPIAKEHNCGRSAKECHERWIRYLKPGVRKGQWTDHEDAIVMDVVTSSSEQPFNRWSDLAQRLPGRVGKQIRDRWVNHLNPNINHLPFSREDDLLLWEGHKKLGKRWVEISTKYFTSSRSENHIKNRWYSASFKKFITNEFGPDAYSGGKASKKDSPSKKKKDGSNSNKSSPPKRQGPAEATKVEAV